MKNNFFAKQCSCGAVTVSYENDEGDEITASMPLSHFRKHFPYKRLEKGRFCNCDHCVNHWGIDLCGCGSGHRVGHCHEGHYECNHNIPAQELNKQKTYSLWN